MRSGAVGMLVFIAYIAAMVLLFPVTFFGLVIFQETFTPTGPGRLTRLLPQLVQWLAICVVLLAFCSIRLAVEWRNVGAPRPRLTITRLVALVLFVIVGINAWYWVAHVVPGSPNSTLRATTALVVALAVPLCGLCAEMLLWWKHDGPGDLLSQNGLTVYLLDHGLRYYGIPAFWAPESLAALADQIRVSGLDWYWEIPAEWIARLAETGVTAFAEPTGGLHAEPVYDLVMVGVPPGSPINLRDLSERRRLLEAFFTGADGPIEILLFEESDGREAYVFVPSAPRPEVRQLLESWGVREDLIRHRHLERQISPWMRQILLQQILLQQP